MIYEEPAPWPAVDPPARRRVDFVFISSMAAVPINLGWRVFTYEGTERRFVAQCAGLVEKLPTVGSRW